MIDRVLLSSTESIHVDTTHNTVAVYVLDGAVQITKNAETVALLTAHESFSLPIDTGVYSITATTAPASVLLFRLFIY